MARAIAVDGTETMDSISVALHTTPRLLPWNLLLMGISNIDSIAVSGLVNDIVRGAVSNAQATVFVNGVPVTVLNRSYLAQTIPLAEGENAIVGEEQVKK